MAAIRKQKVTQIQTPYVTNYEQSEQKNNMKRKGLFRRLIAFAIFAAIISYGLISTLVAQSAVIREKETERQLLDEQLVKLKEEQIYLEEEIVKLNDDEYIAKIARRDYFLSKDGEIIFKIADESSSY
ncbi:septum formation initiator family protein [Bacillus luteolus]|uniref:Septum formation initiator family protein n=1 Tax=Litchfieldia luteola TaxID=682179 RepID=A0ABR9QE25_9BACI|nr:septum formation initiator family protein [Cytobacillus luteolus]MBE4906676.1 septum formation initiator family protein [Cytobacillus luteolus]MBP1944407.1 cell division protein DivIC [Cytobacillus luteolus]